MTVKITEAYIVVLNKATNEISVSNTLKGCSDAVKQYIDIYNLGSSEFNGGVILHPEKGAFAHVSYNGRVWQGLTYVPNGKEFTNEELSIQL